MQMQKFNLFYYIGYVNHDYLLRVVNNMCLMVYCSYSRHLFLLPLHSLCVTVRLCDAFHEAYKHY